MSVKVVKKTFFECGFHAFHQHQVRDMFAPIEHVEDVEDLADLLLSEALQKLPQTVTMSMGYEKPRKQRAGVYR